jgi:hypothetical protein
MRNINAQFDVPNNNRKDLSGNYGEVRRLYFEGYQVLKNLTIPSIDSFCNVLQSTDNVPLHITVNFSCTHLFSKSGGGTGNWLIAFYAMRLATQSRGRTRLTLTCTDALVARNTLIVPWVLGDFGSEKLARNVHRYPPLSTSSVCGGKRISSMPLVYMLPSMEYEMRRMIGDLGVGSVHPDPHAHLQLPSAIGTDRNVIKTDLTEDAVLHVRCGDVLEKGHDGYNFYKFIWYKQLIEQYKSKNKHVKSIGLITQPLFHTHHNRLKDASAIRRQRCNTLVVALKQYLSSLDGIDSVNIHNDASLVTTYKRLIQAPLLIGGSSSFIALPAIARANKITYLVCPDYTTSSSPNQWMRMNQGKDDNKLGTRKDLYLQYYHQQMTKLEKRITWVEPPSKWVTSSKNLTQQWNNSDDTVLEWFLSE